MFVSFLVDTLQECCLRKVRVLVKEDEIKTLEITQTLKEKLMNKFSKRVKYQPRAEQGEQVT